MMLIILKFVDIFIFGLHIFYCNKNKIFLFLISGTCGTIQSNFLEHAWNIFFVPLIKKKLVKNAFFIIFLKMFHACSKKLL